MLRDGPWATAPHKLDRTTVTRPTPEAFRATVKDPTIEVIPLVRDPKATHPPGWCTYSDALDSPETEVICGGVNSKTATAAAVWRDLAATPDAIAFDGLRFLRAHAGLSW